MAAAARRPDEIRALSALAFAQLRDATGAIGSLHGAIADRSFGASGPVGTGPRAIHDAVANGVYATVRAGFGVAGAGVDGLLALREPGDGRPVSASPRGAAALAALTGLIGDRLDAEQSDLQEPTAVRVGGRVVACDPDSLRHAFPTATPRIAVFLHGLMETELAWRPSLADGYGARLRRDAAITPVFVRFNTGLHISDNGRSLARLLDALVAGWPLPVRTIALVGHSMGGLVARSACHYGAQEGAAWAPRVRHIVSLGSPHLGAPIAQAVHVASAALHAVPETRPLSGLLRRRSAGIRDLRHGSLVDEDWLDADPDALRGRAVTEVPLHPTATHCFVAATITRSARHPLGRLVGDLLVLEHSASGCGRRRRIGFDPDDGLHVGGAHHFALLCHPAVYAQLRAWLTRDG